MDFKNYFNANHDLESQEQSVAQISNGVSFKGANLWILIFAILIASLGLNINSTAVIIGAMLISPLMGPIIGMGLSIGTNDIELLKRSAQNYLVATLISIITATIYFLLSPYQGTQSELLARTTPTLYDVLIAFIGGGAGILALCIRDKGNVLPGVAIATALMPPLCTAGYGLAYGYWAFFAGAFFLYFINTVFIALGTFIGIKLMKFRPKTFLDDKRSKVVRRTIIAIVVLTMIPAGIMTWRIMRQSLFNSQISTFIHENLQWEGSQIVANSVDKDSTIRVVAVGRALSKKKIAEAQAAINNYSTLQGYRLRVIQGTVSDSIMALKNKLTNYNLNSSDQQHLLEQATEENTKLKNQLSEYRSYELLSQDIRGELKIIAPQVKNIILSSTVQVSTDTLPKKRFITAIVGVQKPIQEATREQLQKWLKERSHADSLRLIITRP